MAKKPLFVFICDSYFEHSDVTRIAEMFGLQVHINIDYAGAGGSSCIMFGDRGERPVDAENLLVFTGSFHGDVDKGVAYAKEIKAENPRAKIYFRSATDRSNDPVFEKSIRKDDKLLEGIISEFLGSIGHFA